MIKLNIIEKIKGKKTMKNTFKEITKDALKRYLPMIINALCASICVTMAGCTVIGKADIVNTTPVELSITK